MLYVKDLTIQADTFCVDALSFAVNAGEYFFLLGESGSGKSLILETIAGIRTPKIGSIFINDEEITHLAMDKRHVGMVFQSLALFPHRSVYENIAFPLKVRKVSREAIDNEVNAIAEQLQIGKLLDRRPGTLSGGEHQRVALARTLIMKPKVLLLDEPLSSLDILLKEEMLVLLKSLHSAGQTILHVTHDYH
ncbi:MAG: hypothetical protein C0593_11135, partial [Marinilabiliales bacterium]